MKLNIFEGKHPPALFQFPRILKSFLAAFIILLTSGVTTGLVYLFYTTSWSVNGTVEHYAGSDSSEDESFEVMEKYPKSIAEMLQTTHSHWIGFSFIFFFLCGLFYFSSMTGCKFKSLLMTEPFVSAWLTFAGIWGVRFLHSGFVYLAAVTAVLTYLSFYIMVALILYELTLKKSS